LVCGQAEYQEAHGDAVIEVGFYFCAALWWLAGAMNGEALFALF